MNAVSKPVGAVLLALLALAVLAGCDKPKGPARQVAKIALLPDTPPPPPPPPKEEPKPKPVEEPRARPVEQPKPIDSPPPPQPEPLKMEGATGDGPSAFAAGSVGTEYSGGDPVTTGTGASAGGTGTGSDRAQERFFANSARQLLQGEIERHLKSDAAQLSAVFSVWFEADGSIRRFELVPTGDPAADSELNAALDETSRAFRLPPPAGLTQPLRFKLSLRPLG